MDNVSNNGFTAAQLKMIAIAAMTFDHLLWVLFPGYDNGTLILLLHCIGRLTAPIMCFFIAEGYYKTSNLKNYILRLLFLAIISHFAYCFAFGIPFSPFVGGIFNRTGVIWTFLWGIILLDFCSKERPAWQTVLFIIFVCIVAFPSDWSCIAAMIILGFGTNRGDFKKQALSLILFTAMYAAVFFIFIDKAYGIIQMAVVFALPLIKNYNGKKGKDFGGRWFFYMYYPMHLIIIGVIRLALWGNTGILVGGI